MKVTFIIKSEHWGKCKTTLESLKSIEKAGGGEVEAFIVDLTTNYNDVLNDDNELKLLKGNVTVIKNAVGKETEKLHQAVKAASGGYICFVEAGCIYSENLLLELEHLCKTQTQAADVVGIPCLLKTPAANSRFFKFYKWINQEQDIVNLTFTPDVKISMHSAFLIKKDLIKSLDIETNLNFYWSAVSMLIQAMEGVQAIGVLKNAEGNFASQEEAENYHVQSYDEMSVYLTEVIPALAGKITEKHGFTPNWLGNTVLNYVIDWMKFDSQIGADNDAGEAYRKIMFNLLHYISDSVLKNSQLDIGYISFLLEKKHGKSLDVLKCFDNVYYSINNLVVGDEAGNSAIIRFVHLRKDYLEVEGTLSCIHGNKEPEVYLLAENQRYQCNRVPYQMSAEWQNQMLVAGKAFCGRIPLDETKNKYEVFIGYDVDEVQVVKAKLGFGKYTPINTKLKNAFYENEGWIVSYDSKKGCLIVEKAQKALVEQHKKAYIQDLKNAGGVASKKCLAMRYLSNILKKTIYKKKIWLISDRINRGDDNGEAFFEYISKNKHLMKGRKAYFVIEKNCADAKRIRKFGKLVEPMSWKHKILHLISEYIISSQGNDPVVNPFKSLRMLYRDMLQDEKFVFLQHGITKDNMSDWLNKYNRNMYGFIVSTIPEYDSVFEYNYGYTKERVWLTGMPRFDRLYHDEKKYITIMPTWRKSLMAGADPTTSIWLLADGFEQSAYFKFYNELLNNKELIDYAKVRGYKLCFMPHPIIAPYVNEYFKHSEDVVFWDAGKSYREVFAETDLLITDYSSVAFDFAYLRKPILYCHFDRDTFFSGSHSYTEGYFDYERDGFGEITLNLSETIQKIKNYIDNDCSAEEKYLKRINETFAFDDKNNSKRVMEHLLESDK